MADTAIASRKFFASDQQLFAQMSGDVNPMHMDSLAARRLQAGDVVVHGVHSLLWALEQLAQSGVSLGTLSSVNARFKKFLFLDREASLGIVRRSADEIMLEIVADGISCMTMTLKFGARGEAPADGDTGDEVITRGHAIARSLDEMAGVHGWLVPPTGSAEIASTRFPHLTRQLGVERLLAMAQLSTLVGMVCPGLHSIFSALTVNVVAPRGARPGIGFATAKVDPRFRMVTIKVSGSGVVGDVIAFARAEPLESPSMADLATRVGATEFTGSTALIVGGTRGLGAVTAKLIACGGGRVFATYARGAADADALARDIVFARGPDACAVMQLDVTHDPAAALASLPAAITHLYYFATPKIFRQNSEVYSDAIFGEFASVYFGGFSRTVEFLLARADGKPLRVLYPSSVAVTERPKGVTEYAMAKAAAELMCVDLVERYRNLQIDTPRLPRILTDQTATTSAVESADALETMLPLVRSLHTP